MIYKKIFIDSDIILDLLLEREPFVLYSKAVLIGSNLSGKLYTSTLILANTHYLVAKNTSKTMTRLLVKEMTDLLNVVSFDKEHLISAADNSYADFEDSIQYFIAKQHNCDLIITRNIKHYKSFDIPALTAEQFLRTIL